MNFFVDMMLLKIFILFDNNKNKTQDTVSNTKKSFTINKTTTTQKNSSDDERKWMCDSNKKK